MLRLLFTLVLLAVPVLLQAATRYVDGTLATTCAGATYSIASRNCSGSDGTGYKTVPEGLRALVASDVLDIRAGTYTLTSIYGAVASDTWGCTAGCPATWEAATRVQNHPGEAVVVRAKEFHLDANVATGGVQYLIWEGDARSRFIIEHTGSGGNEAGFEFVNAVKHVRLKTLTIRNFSFNGVSATSGSTGRNDDIQVIDNEIYDNGDNSSGSGHEHGVYFRRTDNVLIERNYIHDNFGYPVHLYHTETNSVMNATVRYNLLGGTRADAGDGTSACGIIFATGSGNVAYRNVIIGQFAQNKLRCGLQTLNVASIANFYHNTVYNVSSFGTQTTGTTITERNNIFNTLPDPLLNTSGFVGSNNHCPTADTGCSVTNGVAGFVSAGSNFALAAGSNAIGAGTTITGFACNGTCDIGAFETFGFSSATINEALMDVTLGMNVNTPVLPAAGQTGWTVGCTGSNCGTPVVATAARISGGVAGVRLTLSGLGGSGVCEVGQVWTVTYSGAGNVTDSSLIGNSMNQPMSAFTAQAVTNGCGTPAGSPPAGLLVYYKMNEGTGAILNDETANNNDGTCSGTFAWVAGKEGSGIAFTDATAGACTAPYGSGENPSTQSHTVAFWVNIPSSLTSASRIYVGTNNGTNQRFHISTIGGTWRLGIQSSSASVSASNLAVTSGWNRVCLVSNATGDTDILTVNGTAGTEGASKTHTSYTLASNVQFGAPTGATENPGVTFEDLKIWNSAESCAADWAAAEPPPQPGPGTVTQVAGRVDSAFLVNGAVLPLGAVNAASVDIPAGTSFAVALQSDCTGGDCLARGRRLYASRNGGIYGAVGGVPAPHISFHGSGSDSGLVGGAVSCCLSGALTQITGTTILESSVTTIVDPSQDSSVVNRWVVTLDSAAVATDTYEFKEFFDDGTPVALTEALADAKITVTTSAIQAPTNLRIAGITSATDVTLIWAPNTFQFFAGFRVYRSTTSGVYVPTPVATITPAGARATNTPVTQWSSRNLRAGTYYYVVKAFDLDGNESAAATEVSVTSAGF